MGLLSKWRARLLAARPGMEPPACPGTERIREAERAARSADTQLREALSRGPEVDRQANRARLIHERNNLGPAFWRAMQGREAS